MKISRTERFKKDFLDLPGTVRKKASKQIALLLIDHTHPSLRIEGIKGRQGIYSVRIDRTVQDGTDISGRGYDSSHACAGA